MKLIKILLYLFSHTEIFAAIATQQQLDFEIPEDVSSLFGTEQIKEW